MAKRRENIEYLLSKRSGDTEAAPSRDEGKYYISLFA
jgi:hypothetical protein